MPVQKKRPTTAKDIAEIVGVCRQAVSATLSGRGKNKVSEAKKREILRVAKELGYKSNVAALKLAGHQTRTIGLVSGTDLEEELRVAISEKLRQQNYQLITVAPTSSKPERDIFNDMISRGADGIITTRNIDFSHTNASVPIVTISYEFYDIDVDLADVGYQATKHLIKHNHKRIGFLEELTNFNTDLKFSGYRNALAEIQYYNTDHKRLTLRHNPNFAAGLRALIEQQKVTAFFCAEDHLAWRLTAYLRQHGHHVPENIAVIGYGGHTVNELMNPSLTSVVYPVDQLATEAVNLILKKIESQSLERTTQPILLKPYMHLGNSCGCPPITIREVGWEGFPVSVEQAYKHVKTPPPELRNDFNTMTEEKET